MKSLLILLGALMFLSSAGNAQGAPKRKADDNLTREFAQFRKKQVAKVDYDLSFTFTEEGKDFKAFAVIDVSLNFLDKALSVDFVGKSIQSIVVNGKPLKKWVSRTGSFDLPPAVLANHMKIEINYTGTYSENGHGFQRVVDPVDKNVYIYSDSEPYYAHLLFPCFDQPDLKATYLTTITAPAKWKVISNELAVEPKVSADASMTTVKFKKTPLLSTYLYFVGAGPFVEWNDTYEKLPLVLYARQSIASYVDYKNIFESSKKGLKFYNEYFGTNYPFSKFGQIFIPEFAWGGMENPGAITLNENNIFRGPVTQTRIEGRDNLILHEMAHMWFGDLVTMNWWDDLWLNESFATYMAEITSQRAFNAKGAVLGAISGKGWGYWQDQLVTTHPIETEVLDTRSSKGNFDGITYSKGGASLKQLHFFVGEEGFKKGLENYFKKYAFANTSRADFIDEIAKASNVNLDAWTKVWLQTSGPHRSEAKWTCEKGKIASFVIEQTANASGAYSPHKTKVALYKVDASKLELKSMLDVKYSDKTTTVAEFVGRDCPDFVFPNLEDHDYALWSLDEKSRAFAKYVLTGGVVENSTRLMTWNILAQMVRDSKLPVLDYFDMALAGLEAEKDEALLAIVIGRFGSIKGYFDSYLTQDERNAMAPKLEAVIFKHLQEQPAQSNLQMTYFDFLVSISHTVEAQKRLSDYLKGHNLPEGFVLDQDRRWNVIRQLAAYNFPEIKNIIDAEEKTDKTTVGTRNAFAARTAIPEMAVKKDFWSKLNQPEKIPFSTLRTASGAFHGPNYQKLSESFVASFFQKVTKMDWKTKDDLAEIYFEGLFPYNICSKTLLSESQKQLKQAKNLTPLTKRYWLEANDELSKCVSIRKSDFKI